MKAEERFRWRDVAKGQKIQPYILEAVLKLFEPADDHLYDLDRQRRFISTIHLVPMECPFCDQGCSYYEAVRDVNYQIGNGAKELRCRHCEKELVEIVPFIGAVRWGKKHKANMKGEPLEIGAPAFDGPKAGFAGLNWRQAKALAEKHIEQFQKKLDAHARGSAGVRPDECRRYQEIWRGVLAVATPEGWDSASLASDEKDEVRDAIASGDYDWLLESRRT